MAVIMQSLPKITPVMATRGLLASDLINQRNVLFRRGELFFPQSVVINYTCLLDLSRSWLVPMLCPSLITSLCFLSLKLFAHLFFLFNFFICLCSSFCCSLAIYSSVVRCFYLVSFFYFSFSSVICYSFLPLVLGFIFLFPCIFLLLSMIQILFCLSFEFFLLSFLSF